jgi:hypothetical protein
MSEETKTKTILLFWRNKTAAGEKISRSHQVACVQLNSRIIPSNKRRGSEIILDN